MHSKITSQTTHQNNSFEIKLFSIEIQIYIWKSIKFNFKIFKYIILKINNLISIELIATEFNNFLIFSFN